MRELDVNEVALALVKEQVPGQPFCLYHPAPATRDARREIEDRIHAILSQATGHPPTFVVLFRDPIINGEPVHTVSFDSSRLHFFEKNGSPA